MAAAAHARTLPFSAIVGADDMALALLLSTVAPEIGGVLVRGEKGTAKTTMVRALARVLPSLEVVEGCRFNCDPADPDPDCPDGPHAAAISAERPARLVELPVGATEDRVIGALDLQQALGSGTVTFQPGLLAAAHRGILYVDEVNLLHDHLVDLLLDAAATGRSVVEREGVSVAHGARIVLVGTMNPEEGELRPQLLDRFGLTVEVAAPRDPALRAEAVRRRIAFDRDPAGFFTAYADVEAALGQRIAAARALLPDVELTDTQLITIAQVCAGFEVDGLRADLVTARAAVAHAAWHSRTSVNRADIRAAARLALPHRRRRQPFDAPGLDEDLLDRLLGPDEPEPPAGGHDDSTAPSEVLPYDPKAQPVDGPPDAPGGRREPTGEQASLPAREAEPPSQHSAAPPPPGGLAAEQTSVPSGQTYRPRLLVAAGVGAGEPGRRGRALTGIGRAVGSRPAEGGVAGRLHLAATVRAAAPHQSARGRATGGRLRLLPGDLRLAVAEGRESNLVLLVVDASGSMGARRRMATVKAAALSLLLDAYQRRDKIGLITFKGTSATLALPPTTSVDIAARRLADLPSGGRTPLAEGLLCARETLRVEAIRDPRRRPLLVVITDGRATAGSDAVDRSRLAAGQLRRSGVSSVVIDCETSTFALGLAGALSDHLGAEHIPVGELAAEQLVRTIMKRVA